jgi:hypothetical protein
VRCDYCRTGDSHQCEFYREHGITGLPVTSQNLSPCLR